MAVSQKLENGGGIEMKSVQCRGKYIQ